MRVIRPGTIDERAAQTMRTSLGIVAENSRVCLLVNSGNCLPRTVNMTDLAITVRSGKNVMIFSKSLRMP